MRELKLLTGRTVIVATPATTVRGVVESASRSFLTLVTAVCLDTTPEIPIDGSVMFPVSTISYVQVVE